jgi:hypothetical protein
VEATLWDMVIVSDWAWSAERERLRERDHWLSNLLDGIDEAAAVFSTDGRIVYVNREGARIMHEVTGVSPDGIVGRAFSSSCCTSFSSVMSAVAGRPWPARARHATRRRARHDRVGIYG